MSLLDPGDLGRLRDIQMYGQRAIRHLAGASVEAFVSNELAFDGVVRCLAVVGEAVWKLTKPFQAAHPSIPWTLIATMLHRLVHDYGSVDTRTVYRVVSSDLSVLLTTVDAILAAQPKP